MTRSRLHTPIESASSNTHGGDKSRYVVVADLLRSGQTTPELESEYEALRAEHDAINVSKAKGRFNSVFDLPIARSMWEADGRDSAR
jgi:hypothetical protein